MDHNDQPLLDLPLLDHHDSATMDPDDVRKLLRRSGLDYDVRAAEIIHRLTDGVPALVHAVCTTVPASEIADPAHLAEHVPPAVDRLIDHAIRADRELTAHRRALLLSAAADPLTADSASLLLGGAGDPEAFIALLTRSGMARRSDYPSDDAWHFPDAIRASLLRLAEVEAARGLRDYRRSLVRLWLDLDQHGTALKAAGDTADWALVIHIVREHLDVLYSRDYPTTMADQVLARVPQELLADDPILSRLRSMHHQFATPRDTPTRISDDVVSRAPGHDDDDDDDEATVAMDKLLRAVELRVNGRFDEAADMCDPVAGMPLPDLNSLSTDERDTRGFALVHIGTSYLLAGRFDESISIFRRSFRTAVASFIHRDAAGKLALVYAVLGHTGEARGWLDEERRHPSLPASTEALVRPAGDVAAALLALDRLDAGTAMDVLNDLGQPADREEFWGFILYAWGQLALVNGTPANGLRFIEREMLRYTTMREHGAVVGPLLDAVRADLHLACDRPELAAGLVAESSHPVTAPVRARMLLLADDPVAALSLARTAMLDAQAAAHDALELELIASAAALATGDRPRARRFLAHAVATYRSTRLLRPFRSLPGQVMQHLAGLGHELPVDADMFGPEFGALNWANCDADDPISSDTRSADLHSPQPETLTERELVILRALATGATNREIAERAFVSINTVKSQLQAVYRKLAISSRDDAVAAADRLGLK